MNFRGYKKMLTTLRSSAIHQLKHIKLLQTAIIVEDCYLLTFTLIETVTALFAPLESSRQSPRTQVIFLVLSLCYL